MTNKELRALLDAPRTWERDKRIKEFQNKFIERSGISRRLFDQLFQRCSKKKKHTIERRKDLMDKKNG